MMRNIGGQLRLSRKKVRGRDSSSSFLPRYYGGRVSREGQAYSSNSVIRHGSKFRLGIHDSVSYS